MGVIFLYWMADFLEKHLLTSEEWEILVKAVMIETLDGVD